MFFWDKGHLISAQGGSNLEDEVDLSGAGSFKIQSFESQPLAKCRMQEMGHLEC